MLTHNASHVIRKKLFENPNKMIGVVALGARVRESSKDPFVEKRVRVTLYTVDDRVGDLGTQ